MISYEPLRNFLESEGRSVHYLRVNELVNSNAAKAIANDQPITLERIAKICLFFNIPIEQVLKIENYDK